MSKKLPKATHQGELNINGLSISCAVLEDGTRVISERSISNAIGVKGSGAYWQKRRQGNSVKPSYIYAKFLDPYISEELAIKLSQSRPYKAKYGSDALGLEATILPEICDVWLQASQKGGIPKSKEKVADRAYTLLKGFATVGIISLVDEATGYQDVRVKNALQEILDQYLRKEAKKYEVTFPVELYKEWFRLNKWDWRPESVQKRPKIIGRWTNDYIYERIAPGLLSDLKKKNPKNEKGVRKYKHFQFLTDEVGEPRLREFFGGLIALAKATTSWRKYVALVEKAFPRPGDQLKIFRPADEEE